MLKPADGAVRSAVLGVAYATSVIPDGAMVTVDPVANQVVVVAQTPD